MEMMVIKLYNTLTRKQEVFTPMKDNHVNMFVCGPTVYDFIHIGNARSFSFFDTLAKYLRYRAYRVTYLQNITDIDDKIIRRAHHEKKSVAEVARRFTTEFKRDMKHLNITAVDTFAPATKYIKEIVSQIERLVEKNYAYETDDGIYFDVKKFARYGQLRRVNVKEQAVSRVDVSETKRHPEDFCLWKKHKEGEPSWPSPFGRGRPGWHIEDTAIAEKFFGPQYDLHGGGIDLIFPHHEAEITQMEAISGKHPFVRYWVHNGFVTVNGEKMAKSIGNFVTARDAIERWGAETLRLFFNQTHYKSPINFTEGAMDNTKRSLRSLLNAWERLRENLKRSEPGEMNNHVHRRLQQWTRAFENAMDNDCNTSIALSVLFELSSFINTLHDETKATWKAIEHTYVTLGNILGILYQKPKKEKIPATVIELAEERLQARHAKDWGRADALREKIRALGFSVEDTKNGGYELKKIEKITSHWG
jgi:cysteinyl-tRNA synthetase